MVRFYDIKAKKFFESSKFQLKSKLVRGKKRNFAVTKSPLTGIEVWRVV